MMDAEQLDGHEPGVESSSDLNVGSQGQADSEPAPGESENDALEPHALEPH